MQAGSRLRPSSFVMGIFGGVRVLVLVVGAKFADENGQVGVIWLALMYFTRWGAVYLTCRTFYGDQTIGAAWQR